MSFSQSDIDIALQSGLISEDDAQYLMQHAGGSSLPGLAGMGAGALAGAALLGPAGRKLGDMGMEKFGTRAASGMGGMEGPMLPPAPGAAGPGLGARAADFMGQERVPGFSSQGLNDALQTNVGGMVGSGTGMLAGGAGGYMAGNAMSSGETDQMLQMLMDPETPPEVKQQILAQLQAMQQGQAPQGQEQDQGMNWAGLAAGTAGALAGGLAGGYGSKLLGDMGASRLQAGNPAGDSVSGIMSKNRQFPMPDMLGGGSRDYNALGAGSAGLGGILGAGIGGWGGSELAERPDPSVMRFNDPLGGG